LPDVYAALEEAAAATPAGEWINATGYAHRDYDGQYPDLTRLDEITGDRPLFMRQTSGHAAIVNTEAMRRAGILEPGFTDPVGDRSRRRHACEGGPHLLRRMRPLLRPARPPPHRDQRLTARSGGGHAAGPLPADAAGRWTAHDRVDLGRRVRHRTRRGTAHRP